jgi:hypothetical protein
MGNIKDYSSYTASSASSYEASACTPVVQKADFPLWEAAGFTPFYRKGDWGVKSDKLGGVEIRLSLDGKYPIETKIDSARKKEQILIDLFPVIQAALPEGWTVTLPGKDGYYRYQFFVVDHQGKEYICPEKLQDWKEFYFGLKLPITRKVKEAIEAAVEAPRV